MFTGIIEKIGLVREVRRQRGGLVLVIEASLEGEPLRVGESVAVSGPCLTVERLLPSGFEVYASLETIERTTLGRLTQGHRVNLERALRLGDRLGGHILTGHVDGVGRVRSVVPSGDAKRVTILAPPEAARLLAPKGSVAVDGVSLTVNSVNGHEFSVMLVPHTLRSTTLSDLRPGDEVNIEADILARYVATLLGR